MAPIIGRSKRFHFGTGILMLPCVLCAISVAFADDEPEVPGSEAPEAEVRESLAEWLSQQSPTRLGLSTIQSEPAPQRLPDAELSPDPQESDLVEQSESPLDIEPASAPELLAAEGSSTEAPEFDLIPKHDLPLFPEPEVADGQAALTRDDDQSFAVVQLPDNSDRPAEIGKSEDLESPFAATTRESSSDTPAFLEPPDRLPAPRRPDEVQAEDIVDEESDDADLTEDEGQQRARQQKQNTIAHLMKLNRPMQQIGIATFSAQDPDEEPEDQAAEIIGNQAERLVVATGVSWQVPDRYPFPFCHQPLYFQQKNLERCGRTCHCFDRDLGVFQNAFSGVQFIANTMVVPYRLVTECPDRCVPHQGDCRTCQAYSCDIDPLVPAWRGYVSQAAAIAGFTFLLL